MTTSLRNSRNLLFDGKNSFYATSDNLPVIEKYDLNTLKLISEFDLSNIPVVIKNLNYIAMKGETEKSFYAPFFDSYLTGNFLYILCATLGDGDAFGANHLFRIDLEPEMKLSAILTLPDKIYTAFCVSEDYIYVFNHIESTIDRIKLSDYE